MDKDGNLEVFVAHVEKTVKTTTMRGEVASCYNSRVFPVLEGCYWLTTFTSA
jgi:hypothetical protein